MDGREHLRARLGPARPRLRDEDAPGRQLAPHDILIEIFRVELVAGATEHGVRQVTDDHVKGAVGDALELGTGVVVDEGEPGWGGGGGGRYGRGRLMWGRK